MGGHRLVTHLQDNIAARLGILINTRLVHAVKEIHYLSDRIIQVVLQVHGGLLSIFAVYTPHAGYDVEVLDESYEGLFKALTVCYRSGHKIIVGGDFNTQLDVGDRGRRLGELTAAFNLDVLNSVGAGLSDDQWTFKSALGVCRRIDFILASRSIGNDAWADNLLDWGSDHRCVRGTITRVIKAKRKRKNGFKRARGLRQMMGSISGRR